MFHRVLYRPRKYWNFESETKVEPIIVIHSFQLCDSWQAEVTLKDDEKLEAALTSIAATNLKYKEMFGLVCWDFTDYE